MFDVDWYALQRLTRAASDLGHYNMAKLLAAAAASVVNHALYAESLPRTDRDFAEAVAAIEPMLIDAGLDPNLLESIRRARAIIAARQLILHEDAPPIFVCRVCGEVARAMPPDQCPHCGAGQLTFQLFRPAYYLEPVPIDAVVDQLSHTPDWLDQLVSNLAADQLAQPVGGVEGEWSLLEAAGHLLDAQRLIASRVNLFMNSEAPNLSAKAVWQMVESAQLSAQRIVAEFSQSRGAMLAQLRSAPHEYWQRVGQHAEFGPVTLLQQCSYFAKHEQWHRAQMTRIRHRLIEDRRSQAPD
jgi:uncharacterized damage-inducible protein DinB